MKVFYKRKEYDEWRSSIAPNQSVGFVPTMGALHQGHLSLVQEAIKHCKFSVCSIYVNPTQFDNPNDLAKYPNTLEQDLRLLDEIGCDVVFCPDNNEMYPPGEDLTTYHFNFNPIDTVLEGTHRKGHFKGVGIVVSKLFDLVKPTSAFFGEKDFQQLMIIRRLVELKPYSIHIIGVPTVRENDGLAMSSRNMRLTEHQRKEAVFIYDQLKLAQQLASEQVPLPSIQQQIALNFKTHPDFKLDYFEILDEYSLTSGSLPQGQRCFVAAYIGEVRLIDNMRLIS